MTARPEQQSGGHTPRPWRYSEVIGGCFVYAGNRQILRYTNSPDAENRANARLIAAAPDLLASLIALDAAYCEAHDDMSRATRDHHRAVLIAARAAIAKAGAA